jgi:hypothetical protein
VNSGDVWITIGSAIPFFTYTHNSTNEPTLVVAQPTSHTVFPSIDIPQN